MIYDMINRLRVLALKFSCFTVIAAVVLQFLFYCNHSRG